MIDENEAPDGYRAVDAKIVNSCLGCDLYSNEGENLCKYMSMCMSVLREDRSPVIFKKKQEERRMNLHGYEVKKGDRLWHFYYGWVEVLNEPQFNIEFKAAGNSEQRLIARTGVRRQFFWKEQKLDYSRPLPDLKVDAKVIVWDGGGSIRLRRHFKEWSDNGNIVVFGEGRDSFTSSGRGVEYENWEIVEEAPDE